MSDRVAYVIMKDFFNQKIDQMFEEPNKKFHGWEKQDFLNALYQEIALEQEEESYDLVFEDHLTMQ